MTSTDAKALAAAVHILELYAYDRHASIISGAFSCVVHQMHPQCRELAYHAIAHVMEWSDREPIWKLAGLPALQPRKCAFES